MGNSKHKVDGSRMAKTRKRKRAVKKKSTHGKKATSYVTGNKERKKAANKVEQSQEHGAVPVSPAKAVVNPEALALWNEGIDEHVSEVILDKKEEEEEEKEEKDVVKAKYFSRFNERGLRTFTQHKIKMLYIRKHISDLIYLPNYNAIDSMIRGILYTNRRFCSEVIMWRNIWEQDEGTMLHEILSKSKADPSTDLVQMLIDISPEVITVRDVAGFLPIELAVHRYRKKQEISLDIIKLIAEADKTSNKVTLSRGRHNVMNSAVFRGDVDVVEYLLKFSQCRQRLVDDHPRESPLYNSSRDNIKDGRLSAVFQVLLRATAKELGLRSTESLSSCVDICADYMHDLDTVRRLL